ncbi:MAG: 16S rRNA (cytidine(1402)-2'-O)-methyltransferase [Alphaproteobacteria bacterium]|nr:16S rRNA (cytidine(1402)-2'-O)-methyltransferase [Alphaproteobacteria bacterium]
MPSPGLHIVATPIGNLADITLRALQVLEDAHVIACEDRRVTVKLLRAHGIATPTLSYHEHNADRVRPAIIERLKKGETVALVSDAGTPLISDPGYKLVRAAQEAGMPVHVAPGPSAALAALVVSGLPTNRFLFAGFLPARAAARRAELTELAKIPATLILFEPARRLPSTLAAMADVLGARQAAVVRELTKLHEEVRRGALTELADHYAAADAPKGEVVILVAGAADGPAEFDEAALDEQLCAALAQTSLKQAVATVSAATGLPRRQIYARALALTGKRAGTQEEV